MDWQRQQIISTFAFVHHDIQQQHPKISRKKFSLDVIIVELGLRNHGQFNKRNIRYALAMLQHETFKVTEKLCF